MGIEIVMPAGALGASKYDSAIDKMLRKIAVAASPDPKMEWAEKHGTEVDNAVFMMHPFCWWCGKEDCQWCSGKAPNFCYKPTDFRVTWYKFIGRDTETNREITPRELKEIQRACLKAVK